MTRKMNRAVRLFGRKKSRPVTWRSNQGPAAIMDSDSTLAANPVLSAKQRRKVIATYAKTLEKHASSCELELHLPYSKAIISYAIYAELQENPDGEWSSQLAVAYVQLEAFVSPAEYRIVKEFKAACAEAEQMARSGNPADIIESAKILRRAHGSRAVRIVERISEKMRKRFEQVKLTGIPMDWSVSNLCPV